MSKRDAQRVLDILERSDSIAQIVGEGEEKYLQENMRVAAMERHIEIIGEASSHLSEETKSFYSKIPWWDIVGLRNRLAHQYGRIDKSELWILAISEIPAWAQYLREKPLAGEVKGAS